MTEQQIVRVYTTPGCQPCRATTRKLSELGIRHELEDARDPGNLAAIRFLGHTSAPVVVVGDEHWSGYRPDLIKQLAERIGAGA